LTEFKARVDTYFARTRTHQHKQDTRYKMTDRHTSSWNRNYIENRRIVFNTRVRHVWTHVSDTTRLYM